MLRGEEVNEDLAKPIDFCEQDLRLGIGKFFVIDTGQSEQGVLDQYLGIMDGIRQLQVHGVYILRPL